jgi:hypothetical protein
MEDDQGLERHLDSCQPPRGFDGPRDQRSRLTIEFGSLKRGERALQTSWIAPSSDHVAAMIGSRYCPERVGADIGSVRYERANLCLGGCRLWFARVLDDLFERRHLNFEARLLC